MAAECSCFPSARDSTLSAVSLPTLKTWSLDMHRARTSSRCGLLDHRHSSLDALLAKRSKCVAFSGSAAAFARTGAGGRGLPPGPSGANGDASETPGVDVAASPPLFDTPSTAAAFGRSDDGAASSRVVVVVVVALLPPAAASASRGPAVAAISLKIGKEAPPTSAESDKESASNGRLASGGGGAERSRAGCGLWKSCFGHCPNSLICVSIAARSIGSSTCSISTAPS
mmetsp:Transcript_14297/g.46955  ORF Transcript_14297/g.46955 Transcript_14297/m.46955 type:complete len:228 (+) Transcript_14297:204-887(+)